MLGLTGAILVFYVEIDQGLSRELAPTRPLTAPSSHQALLDALHRAHPDRHGAWRNEASLEPGRPIMVRYYRPAEKAGFAFSPLMASVDPATLAVGLTCFWGDSAMTWIYDVHYSLLLDRTVWTVVAVVGFGLLVSFRTGVYGVIVFAMLALTGAMLNEPTGFNPVID